MSRLWREVCLRCEVGVSDSRYEELGKKGTRPPIDISEFDRERDSLDELTRLLQRAYAGLAAMGLNYVAATQSAQTTARRIGWSAACWVARTNDDLAGTLCYYDVAHFPSEPEWYRHKDVAHFAQFAVEPELQRCGIGSALLAVLERRARADGKAHLACDTAVDAASLIAFYEKRGFREIGRQRWPHATYESCILSKALT